MVSQIHKNYTNPQRFHEFETRPRMLKDFLSDENFDVFPSSSKHGNSKSCGSTVQLSSSSKSTVLLRSRSKRAVSAIHQMINVVRLFQFATTKSPLILPRSFSRKASAKNNGDREGKNDSSEAKLVKVKDILRWRSFRDLAEDESKPLDLPSSPVNSASPMTFSSSACSKKSSWCDSDFTADELYENIDGSFVAEKPVVGQRSTLKNLKGEWQLEESAQQSPVSILDSPFREDILPRLENIKRARCRLMQRIEDLDSFVESNTRKKPVLCNKTDIILEEERLANEAEAKATKLHKESNLAQFEKSQDEERLIFEFSVHELSINIGNVHDTYKFEQEIIGLAQSWLNGDYEESYEWKEEKNRVAYVQDMEKELCWKNFRQDQEETVKGLEINLLNELLDEFLDEVIS